MDNVFIQSPKWLLKWIGIAVGSLIALALIVTGIGFAWNWYNFERHAAKIEVLASNDMHPGVDHLFDNILPADYTWVQGISASREKPSSGRNRCSGDFPIFIGFVNGSTKTVTNIRIHVTASLPGHSTNILSYKTISMDDIVPPKNAAGYCYSFQVDEHYKSNVQTENAVYRATLYDVQFSQ